MRVSVSGPTRVTHNDVPPVQIWHPRNFYSLKRKIVMSHLTAKELKELLKDVEDDTIVCGIGHFGETLQIEAEGLSKATLDDSKYTWRDNKKVDVFVLTCQDSGPDPD